MNGKGSNPRPLSVSREEYAQNFDRVFGGASARNEWMSRGRRAREGTERFLGERWTSEDLARITAEHPIPIDFNRIRKRGQG